jgi:hypothetical protein
MMIFAGSRGVLPGYGMVHAQAGAPHPPRMTGPWPSRVAASYLPARVLARLEGLEPPILPVRSRVLCPLSYKR